MKPKVQHPRCWCQYPAEDCGNVGCSDKPHRERLIVAAHNTEEPMAELWGEMFFDIHFCPVCGKELRR